MTLTIFKKKSVYNNSSGIKKNVGILLALFISIIALTIFQDFLESNRSGYSFYFSESILFKTIWIIFIPILTVLDVILKNQNLNSFRNTILFIGTSIIIHLVLLSFVFLCFSFLFYDGRYDLYKIITYTLSNDLYKLVIIYAGFVFGYKYLSFQSTDLLFIQKKSGISKIIIGNGKNNIIVEISDIYLITAAAPYISIQLEEKKYLHTETLKSILARLDNDKYVRVHKSTIVNLDKVVSFKSRLNGDYDIFLKNSIVTRLSRTYVSNFKLKFDVTHQVST